MFATKHPHAEPLPGYRLLEPLGRGGVGEVWKCQAPGGLCKAIKFVSGATDNALESHALAAQELAALQRIKDIRHPFLLSLERVEIVDGELTIVMELAEQSLQDLFDSQRRKGQPGIARQSLLSYMWEAAEVLDVMNQKHGLQHLDVKPGNLFLVGGHVKVADFGLVHPHFESGNSTCDQPPPGLTPVYAAPEVFHGQYSHASDQYSLAIVYQELLTGQLPFTGNRYRQLLFQHVTGTPDVSALPDTDQAVVRRALAKQPDARYPSCQAFVEALFEAAPHEAISKEQRQKLQATRSAIDLDVADENALGQTHLVEVRNMVAEEGLAAVAQRDTTSDSTPSDARGTVVIQEKPKQGVSDAYRFLRAMGENAFGQTWLVADAANREYFLKYVADYAKLSPAAEDAALAKLQGARHPGLAALRHVTKEHDRIVLLTDVAKENLWGRWQRGQRNSEVVLAREDVLDIFEEVAHVLDDVANDHRLYHLALNPQNILLNDAQTFVSEMGLAQLLWLPKGEPLGPLNTRYAAPELFDEDYEPSQAADVFSLAVSYAHLITGRSPFKDQVTRRKGSARERRLDLDLLNRLERDVVAKALRTDATRRFASCGAFVEALRRRAERKARVAIQTDSTSPLTPPPEPLTPEDPLLLTGTLVQEMSGEWQSVKFNNTYHRLTGKHNWLHHCGVRVIPSLLRIVLNDFARRWSATVASEEEAVLLRIRPMRRGVWDMLTGKEKGLDVRVRVIPSSVAKTALTAIRVEISAHGCAGEAARNLVRENGPPLIESLRTHLQANPERRLNDRLAYNQPLDVEEVNEGGRVLEGVGKDVSITGMGLYLHNQPTERDVRIHLLMGTKNVRVALPARIVRTQLCQDGRWEVGVRFVVREEVQNRTPPAGA